MIGVLDFETSRFEQEGKIDFKFGYLCFYSGSKIARFLIEEIEDVFIAIENVKRLHPKENLLIFSHNLDYEFKFLYRYMTKKFELKMIDSGGCIYSIKVYRHDKKLCEFRNSLRLFPYKLSDIGKSLNIRKLEMDESNIEKFKRYCRRDCDIVYKALKKLIDFFSSYIKINENVVPLSISSLSYKIFHSFNGQYEKDIVVGGKKKRKVNILTDIPDYINSEFRQFYFGGRVEVFDFNVYSSVMYLDFNSLYPSIMINNAFPAPPYTRTVVKREGMTIPQNAFAMFCEIDESDEHIPIVASKIDNKLAFAACKKESIITREEYLYLKEHRPNTSVRLKELWLCSSWCNPFEYMRTFYNKRVEIKKEKKTNVFEMLIKLLLNSGSGKFGERSEKEKFEFKALSQCTPDDLDDENAQIEGDFVFFRNKTNSRVRTNLAFSHRITALARLELAKTMDFMASRNIKFIYCDTDSLVVENSEENKEKLKNIMDPFALGKMKIENVFSDFQAYGCKEYIFKDGSENRSKIKGVARDVDYSVYLKEGISKVRPVKWKEAMKRRLDVESAIEVKKYKRSFYDKRKILNDLSTIPIDNTLVDNKEMFKTMFEQRFKIVENEKKRVYRRLIKSGKYYQNVVCPICSENIIISKYIDASDSNDPNSIIQLVHEHQCVHLLSFDDNVVSNRTHALFVK